MTTTGETKRVYKSRTDRMIDGVCGGFAEYFGLDSTLVRIAWVLLALLGGAGVILYILAMIIMPKAPLTTAFQPTTVSAGNQKFWGILLIAVGLVWLLANFGMPLWFHWWHLSWDIILAVALILAGVAFLFGGRSYVSPPPVPADASTEGQSAGSSAPSDQPPPRTAATRLYRSRLDRKIFGVCGGLGKYFNLDSTIIRLLFVASAIASFGITLLIYILLAIVVPEESLIPNIS